MKTNILRFSVKIVLPALLSILLFSVSIFYFTIPYFERNLLDRKQEMIKELVNAAVSILDEHHELSEKGEISVEEAQKRSITIIKYLRYGEENKDYFWITDLKPVMIIHPYRSDLNGSDLSDYEDRQGKKLFMEAVKLVKKQDHGYLNYMWQWKDDSSRVVPKLSYVRLYKPWGWVIGTGIYIEDVNEEINKLTQILTRILLIITLVVILIELYIIRQNLILDRKQIATNKKLIESKKKYKALVEASTEGVVMTINNQIIYHNPPVCSMLKYTPNEFSYLTFSQLLDDNDVQIRNILYKKNTDSSKKQTYNFETRIKRKDQIFIDVILTISNISIDGEYGYIIAIKDISRDKEIKNELDQEIEKFNKLTDNVNIGIFRATAGRKARILEINPSAIEVLGFQTIEELQQIDLWELIYRREDKAEIIQNLAGKEKPKPMNLTIKQKDGSLVVVQLSLSVVKDVESGKAVYIDGIIQDITAQQQKEKEREAVIEELQTANLFLNQPLKTIVSDAPSCSLNCTVVEAAKQMSLMQSGAIIITTDDENKAPIGILTDGDIRKRVVANQLNLNTAVYEVMTSPIIFANKDTLLFEALLTMNENNVEYLCVRPSNKEFPGIVSIDELANAQHQTIFLLIKRIQNSGSIPELQKCYKKLSILIKAFIESGGKINTISKIISKVADEINLRLIHLALKQTGTPPAKFAFVLLGSQAREEQTFITDQDNAVIFENVDESKKESTQKYFLKLAAFINDGLDAIGYKYCSGEIMAKNPKWCQPLDQWKKYFAGWLQKVQPQDLIDISVFFDIRFLYGDKKLINELKAFLAENLKNKAVFFYHYAQTIISLKPPISFFGNFVVESTKENKSAFDIKKVIVPIVGFARIYDLKYQMFESNTMKRIELLYKKNIINKSDYKEITQAYNFLMMLRINHQLQSLEENIAPDNYINPKKLTDIERTMLKKIFSQISNFQNKLSLSFKGSMS